MKKQPNAFVDYRKRVLDPVSPSFCAAKWLNATLWLWSGRTASCHHPDPHKISLEQVLENPSALHNTDRKKDMRFLMRAGARPPECEYCWKIEDVGADRVSDRVFKSQVYADSEIARIAALDPGANVVPKMLEVAFDRVCGFACAYCHPSYSMGWARDIQANGPYQGLQSDDRILTDGSEYEQFPNAKENPYIQAFWKWWPELSRELQEIRITGGEPLLSPEIWKFFDYFTAHPESPLTLALNTSLGAPPKLIDKLIESSHAVSKLDVYTSCEATGAQAEYIRDGLQWDRFIADVERLLRDGNCRLLSFMMTVNLLCLFSITEFMNIILELKAKYPKTLVSWNLNILNSPDFMSPLVLPAALRRDRVRHLEKWLSSKGPTSMSDMDSENVRRLIEYLGKVHEPKSAAKPPEVLADDMKKFFVQYDKRRGKDIRAVFPEPFVRWYDTL